MDAKLFIGGCPNPMYPNDNGYNYYKEPHATRVAYEYANGEFTLGWPLHPMAPEANYQRVEMDDANLEVGDHILMYVVPELHVLREVMVRVDNPDARLAGAALKPSAMLYDAATKEYTEDPVLDDLFENVALDVESIAYATIQAASITIPAQDIDPGDGSTVTIPAQTITTAGPYFVPKGKTLVLGWKVAALPTDTTVKLSRMQACASIISKVGGFDIPTNV